MSVVTATILSAGQEMDPSYELVSLDISREMNRIPSAQLTLLDGDAAQQSFPISNTDFFEPGKEIEIKLRHEGADDEVTVFKGLVVRHGLEADTHGLLLTVDLKDVAVKLTSVRKSAVYTAKTDDKVISELITGSGLQKGTISVTPIEHSQLVQYACTDWDFILSRAEICGRVVVVDDGTVSLPEIAVSEQVTHSFEFGIDEILNFAMTAEAEHQYPDVQSVAWDLKNQKLTRPAAAKDIKIAQGNLDPAKIAGAVGNQACMQNNAVSLDPKELQSWADSTMARTRMAMLRGRIAVPGFGKIKLMEVMELSGLSDRFNGKTLITGLRHRLGNFGWQTDIQFGLSPKRFTEQPDIVDVQASGLLPAVNGLQIGVVDQFTEDPDKELRVKVILPGIDEKQGSVWARLASPDAGKERGCFFRPEPGDEVVVGFFNDDPRQPVVLGSMFGSKNAQPKDLAVPTAENREKGIVTKTGTMLGFVDNDKPNVFIRTPGGNSVVFDDDAQTVEIADQHGNAITMSKDGIVLKSTKDLILDAKGNVEIKGTKVNIK